METARRQMVDQQVRTFDVSRQSVLELLRRIPRDEFAPIGYGKLAYADTEIPLAHGQFMMTPTVEGRLLQALALTSDDEVLEVGTGSGFLTACLAALSRSVTSIDLYDDFVENTSQKLKAAGVTNAHFLRMDASQELPRRQFDVVALTASLPVFDERYLSLLKPHGRLFVIAGESPVMEATLIARDADMEWQAESLFETSLLPLITPDKPGTFRF